MDCLKWELPRDVEEQLFKSALQKICKKKKKKIDKPQKKTSVPDSLATSD